MVTEFGEIKTATKINSKKLEFRDDPTTGLSGEWDVEYKIYTDSGEKADVTIRTKRIEFHEDVEGEEALLATASMDDSMAAMVGEKSSGAGAASSEARSSSSGGGGTKLPANIMIKTEGVKTIGGAAGGTVFAAIVGRLKSEPKKVLRAVAAQVTCLKETFEATKNNRYTGTVHSDCTALIPTASSLYTTIEWCIIEKVQDEATLLAVAKSHTDFTNSYDELMEWCDRLMPKRSRKQ